MLHTLIWRHLKRKDVVDTKSRKVTAKIVASVFTKTKWHAHGVNNYMGMIIVGLSTACLLLTSE